MVAHNTINIQDIDIPLDGYDVIHTDPVINSMMHYLRFCLQESLGAMWYSACTKVGKLDLRSNIVQQASYIPLQMISLNQFNKMPMLQIERTKSEVKNDSNFNIRFISTFAIHFILPAMESNQLTHLYPFMNDVSKVIFQSLKTNRNVNYTNVKGVLGGAAIFADFFYGENKVDFGSLELGDDRQSLIFPTLSLTVSGFEKSEPGLTGEEYVTAIDGYQYVDTIAGGLIQNRFIVD